MLKKLPLVGLMMLGMQGVASAQSSGAALSLPPSLASTLTQHLSKAAKLIEAQTPLWSKPAAASAPAASKAPRAGAAAPALTSAAAVAPAAASSPDSLPALPGDSVIAQVVTSATQQTQPEALPTAATPRPQRAPVQAAARPTAKPAARPVVVARAPAIKPAVKVSRPAQSAVRAPLARSSAAVINTGRQRGGVSRVVRATAYSSDVGQTDSTPFITATGTRVRPGVIALSRDLLRVFPYGSRVTLQDSAGLLTGRVFIVEDTMNVRLSNTIDIWMGSRAQAYQWGARTVTVTAVR